MQKHSWQRHQWLALTLLVTMVVILLLDTTRAVSALLPEPEPPPMPANALEPGQQQPLPQDMQPMDERRLALASRG